MAGGTASVNDVANNVGRESSSVDLGEMERESGDDEIGGKIRVRNGVIAVVTRSRYPSGAHWVNPTDSRNSLQTT
ncbi:hypothetical protein AgCh_010631 [Apium graveolens]